MGARLGGIQTMVPGQSHEAERVPGSPISVPGYEVLKAIGRGSYGTVFLARGPSGLWRAIKVCRRDDRNGRDFERELRGLRRYEPVSRTDPGFRGILDLGENRDEGYFYCVMELADDVAAEESEDRSVASALDPTKYLPRTLAHELRGRGHLELSEVLARAAECVERLQKQLDAASHIHDEAKRARMLADKVRPAMNDAREAADLLEHRVADAGWGLPKYREMLFVR